MSRAGHFLIMPVVQSRRCHGCGYFPAVTASTRSSLIDILWKRWAMYLSTLYCTISTVSSVTRNGQKKSPCFKSLELKRKFIGHLGQQIFRIRELTVEMVQYLGWTLDREWATFRLYISLKQEAAAMAVARFDFRDHTDAESTLRWRRGEIHGIIIIV